MIKEIKGEITKSFINEFPELEPEFFPIEVMMEALKIELRIYTEYSLIIFLNNKFEIHRENLPAAIGFYNNGNIEREEYYMNDLLHREDGPAIKLYEQNGFLYFEDFYIKGKNIVHFSETNR